MIEPLLVAFFLRYFEVPSSHIVRHRFNSLRIMEQVGDLLVTSETPARRSIPRGSQRVPVLALKLEATCEGSVTVEALTVHRKGLGDAQDILGVYAVREGGRITPVQSVARDGRIDLQFRTLSVPACGTKRVDILADFAPDSAVAGEHRFEIEASTDIDAPGAHVTVVRGMGTSIGRMVGPLRGSITVEILSIPGGISVGENELVGRFLLEADSRDDHHIRAITFTNEGTAKDRDLRAITLYVGTRRLSDPMMSLQGRRVRIPIEPPLLVRKNQSVRISLRADVFAGVGRTVELTVEEPGDVEAEVVRGRE